MAGTPAETQQRRAEEAARTRHIRASLQESFQAENGRNDDTAERPLDPQLVEAFKNLWDHTIGQEEYESFMVNIEQKGHKREDVNWDFIRWTVQIQQEIIQEKDNELRELNNELRDLNGAVQVLDSDLADT